MEPLPPSTSSHQQPSEPSVMEDIPPGPGRQEVMNSIQDITVFAWSISMLNDNVSNDNASNMVDGEIYAEQGNVRAPDAEREDHMDD
jgi:hypothetical protein